MWVFLLAFLGITLAWTSPLILAPMGVTVAVSIRVAVTVGLLLLVAIVLAFRRWRDGSAARALEREILKQSEQQAMNVRPDRRAEILELRDQMQASIAGLRSSKFGGQGASVLHRLPWYVIIGPPGAGKTTALRESGLSFAGGQKQVGKQVGGTRNCDWWFSNDAILLDTAGRYAVRDDDQSEWFGLLDLIRRYRKNRPINGIVMAINLAELADGNEDTATTLARRLRARADEIMVRLEMVVPVYVVFTKTDQLIGFTELFADLRKNDRDQVLGATFPLSAIATLDPAKAFEAELERLGKVIHARALRRVGNEPGSEQRVRALSFPVELTHVQQNLSAFVGALFHRNRYQGTPLFRGFYFTSATQEGEASPRATREARSTGGSDVRSTVAMASAASSYFIGDLFRRVIFPDQNIAARTRAGARRHLAYRVALAGGSILASAIIVIVGIVCFGRNRALTNNAATVTKEAQAVDWTDDRAVAGKVATVETLGRLVDTLEQWETEGAPIGMRWGMYVGNSLLPVVRAAYVADLERAIRTKSQPEMENALRAFTSTDADGVVYSRQFDQLKLYLMMGDLEKLDPAWAEPILARQAAKSLHSVAVEADAKALTPVVHRYLTQMKRKHAPAWKLDEELVASARKLLLRAPQLERFYGAMIRGADADVAPLRAQDIFYGAVAPLVKSKRGAFISGAYTKAGYQLVKRQLENHEKLLTAENWVLDEPTAKGDASFAATTVNQLREMYFERFTKTWKDFLLDLEVKAPDSDASSIEILGALSEPEWAYLRLIRTLADNAKFEIEDGVLGKLLKKRAEQQKNLLVQKLRIPGGGVKTPAINAAKPSTPVEEDFAPLLKFGAPGPRGEMPAGLSQYVQGLTTVVAALTDYRDTSLVREKTAKQRTVDVAFANTLRSTRQAVVDLGECGPLVSKLLLVPLQRAGGSAPPKQVGP
jgi:type VI secretion system protein ImpL